MSKTGFFGPIDTETVKEKEEKKEALEELGTLCKLYKIQEKQIEEIEESLEVAKKLFENTSRKSIPNLIKEYGFSEIKLDTGEKVIVEEKLKVNLSGINIVSAIEEMINLEYEESVVSIMKEVLESKKKGVGTIEELREKKAFCEEVIMSLFKRKIIIENTEEVAKLTKSILDDYGIEYDETLTIHNATLKKYCKERRGRGQKIPEKINVFVYKETKIK